MYSHNPNQDAETYQIKSHISILPEVFNRGYVGGTIIHHRYIISFADFNKLFDSLNQLNNRLDDLENKVDSLSPVKKK